MDFLNKALAQISDLFRSMTPGARITAGLLLVAVVVSLVYLFTGQISGPDCDLMSGVPIPASQLTAMQAAFAEASLNSYEVRGTQIFVPLGQRDRYMAALARGNALPENIHEVFDKAVQETGPFMGNQEREERMKVTKQKALAMVIRLMPGIENAIVFYDKEAKPGFRQDTEITASVNVKPEGTRQLDEAEVTAIRHLVARAIAGLKPEKVDVTDLSGSVCYSGDPEKGASAHENLLVAVKRVHEQEWRAKILNALSYVKGVKVTTDVLLDPEQVRRTRSIKYEPKPTAVREVDESSTSTKEGSGPQGRPGYVAQQPNTPTTLAASRTQGTREDSEESKRIVDSVPGSEQTESQTLGLTPKRVSVAISVPSSYFEDAWRNENPTPPGEEPKAPDKAALDKVQQELTTKIRQQAAAVLPLAEGVADMTQLVTVTVFPDIPGEPLPTPTLAENAITWFGQYWSTVALIVLALFSLAMLRSMVRTAPPLPAGPGGERIVPAPGRAAAGREGERGGEGVEETAEETAFHRLSRFTGSGPSLRDELSELVQEDPDTAANILRNWIGSVI